MIQEDRLRWKRRHGAIALVAVFSVAAFAIPHVAEAGVWESIRDALLNFFGYILLFIAGILGKLVMLVVNGLIGVAQYNNFVNSQPVTIGWPLVRDVVNMFFIVVMLLVSFSTIIGYEPFHYKKTLPKLLLMAIMINFSKTMLGLLIDFSQVLVLTFVTAFKQAAAGNFVTALKLDKTFKLQQDMPEEPKDIIGAIFLAVVLLGVMLSATLIMLVFMIFRIVGLWILLIMSPIAFFALALPDKMKKGVSPFTDDFWSRLTTLLIAGPAMAFFLWLSLAIAQGPDPFFEAVGDSQEAQDALRKDSTRNIEFSSAVGNPADITTFIVAIMLMLQGVEFGLKSAGQMSKVLGGTLGKYVTPQALARGAGRVSWGVTKFAAKTTGKGVAKGVAAAAGGIDTLTKGKLSGALGRGMQAVAQRMPGNLGMKAATSLQGRFGRKVSEKAEKFAGLTKGLSAGQAMKFYKSQGSFLTPAAKAAATSKLGQIAMSPEGLKALETSFGSRKNVKISSNPEMYAKALAQQEAMRLTSESYKLAKSSGDDATVKSIEERMKKRPGLMGDESLREMMLDTTESPKAFYANKNAAAFNTVKASTALLVAGGAMKDGNVDKDSVAWKELSRNPERMKVVDAYLKSTSVEQRAAVEAAIRGTANANQIALAAKVDGFIGKGGPDKNYVAVSFADGKRIGDQGAERAERGIRLNIENERAQGLSMLREAERQGPAVYYGDPGNNARNRMLVGGVNLAPIFNYNISSGEFAKKEDRDTFESAMAQTMSKAGSNDAKSMEVLMKMDLSDLKEGPSEMRTSFAAAMDPMALAMAFKNAKDAGNAELQKKIAEMADIVRQEAAETNKIVSKAKVGSADLQRLSYGGEFEGKTKIVTRLVDAGAGNEARAINVAKASFAANQINNDEQFREIRGVVGKRAQQSTKNRGQARVDDDDDVT